MTNMFIKLAIIIIMIRFLKLYIKNMIILIVESLDNHIDLLT